MYNVRVEQFCESSVTNFEVGTGGSVISMCLESMYSKLQRRCDAESRILINVSQTINTETYNNDGVNYISYIITLVGTVVRSADIEAQQRMAQFDPRQPRRGGN